MRILSFAGTRYKTSPDGAGRMAAPPYDQIDERLRDRLQQEPLHFAHLTRPVARDAPTPAAAAARLHHRWSRAGIVARERQPSLYPYAIDLQGGGTRFGLCALVGIEPAGSRAIRPHERTVARTVAERLELLRETRIDLEPILLLFEDGGELDRLLAEDLGDSEPVAEHSDPEGNVHRLHRVTDRRRIRQYQELAAAHHSVIADGHHRYEVAQRHATESAAGGAAACKLAVITSLASPTLTIAPIHRALRRLPHGEALAALAGGGEMRPGVVGGDALARAVERAPQPALGLLVGTGEARILSRSALGGDRSASPRAAVMLLHHRVLPALGLEAAASTDGTVVYRSDADRLFADVRSGRLAAGFWLPPLTPDDFARAVADGGLLPPKSTRFLPKVVSGLVWAEHDTAVA